MKYWGFTKEKLFTSLPLFIITIVCVIIIFFVNEHTKDKIYENKQRAILRIITEVITVDYDNDPLSDWVDINVPEEVNKDKTVTLYRFRKHDELVGFALMPITSPGYNDWVNLVLGISSSGSILGVKVLSHKETDGFGDKIHQSKSDWLKIFKGQSINKNSKKDWALKKDNGKFAHISGATITSRGVVNTIYPLLVYHLENKELFIEGK